MGCFDLGRYLYFILLPHISTHNASAQASYNHISQRLTQLAEETDSLVAMQHQQPDQNGKPVFTYTIFGKGELPEGLIEKKIDQSSHISVETNYFIFDGNLKIERLSTELNQYNTNLWGWGVATSSGGEK